MNNQIIIYKSQNNNIQLEVKTTGDTVWLTQKQMSELFNVSTDNIGLHIKNIFNEKELDELSTTEESSLVQTEGKRTVERIVKMYNLDVIISVGYRVKSQEGVYFRKWANEVLKQFLIKGYAVNELRLKQLNKTLEILSRSYIPEISGIFEVINKYSSALKTLDDYDNRVIHNIVGAKDVYRITVNDVENIVNSMKDDFNSSLFGKQKDESLSSSIGAIYQTFEEELYKSTQEKAVHLLYFMVKNHSFIDGNKRIAAATFIFFLDKNNILYKENKEQVISNNELATITLMIALSSPNEKDLICNLISNMLIGGGKYE